jgi:hypothetical protein
VLLGQEAPEGVLIRGLEPLVAADEEGGQVTQIGPVRGNRVRREVALERQVLAERGDQVALRTREFGRFG